MTEAAVGRTLLITGLAWLGCVAAGQAHASKSIARASREGARAFTDGHLRPGHLETIRVKGFPGKGRAEVSFFPSAICESQCGTIAIQGARTNGDGSAKFRVRMPGTFLDHRNRHAYFRSGEQIEVEVEWSGPHRAFAVASAYPDPILIRAHRHRNG